MNNKKCVWCFQMMGNSLHEYKGFPLHSKCEKEIMKDEVKIEVLEEMTSSFASANKEKKQ